MAAVINRFSSYELTIRRLHMTDPDFRDACFAFRTAFNALATWQSDAARADDYRCLLAEIEAEILGFIRATVPAPPQGEGRRPAREALRGGKDAAP
ncbi:MAG: hypothetical protein J0H54_08150 [Rhizobiales bacterium]|nr:hypothetical protein [Hyphomicrobiales bacterium]